MQARPWIAALLLPAAVCLSAVAQTQNPAKKAAGVIAGRVTAGGKPLANIAVILDVPEKPGSAMASKVTDQEGHFQFTNITAGQYQVTPRALAYATSNTQSIYLRGVVVTLEEGESVNDINIALIRGGVITGRVTDAEGRPVIGESIDLRLVHESGRFVMVPSLYLNQVRTDDRGIYRVFGLASGRYIVAVGKDARAPNRPIDSGRYYRRTYHPEAAEEAKAKVVEVSEGGEVSGVDIMAGRLTRSYSVTGRAVDEATGKPVPNLMLSVGMTRDGAGKQIFLLGRAPSQSDATGKFRLEDLAPGRYAVLAIRSGDVYSDPTAIEIIDKDVTEIEIRMKRGAAVTGVVAVEGTDDPAVRSTLSQAQLIAFLASEASPYGSGLQINPDGSFRIAGLASGKLTFQFMKSEATQNLSLLRVERDGVMQADGIAVSAGEQIQNVRIVLGYGTGIVRGQIKIENGELPPDALVRLVLFRSGGGIAAPPIMADRQGKFLFERVAAGECEVSVLAILSASRGKPINFKPVKEKVQVTNGAESQVVIHVDLGQTQKEDR